MKVLLSTLNTKYVHSNLALRYLYATTKDKYDVILKEFSINEEFLKVLSSIMEEKANVIAFSCYIWNIELITKLIKTIKDINPEIKIIVGGPEVSYDSEEFMAKNKGVDYVVIGEGEEAFVNLLSEIEMGTVTLTGTRHENKQFNMVSDLSIVPRPKDYEFWNLKDKVVYYEASRGCPYNCSYCLSSTTKGVRIFDINRVKEDLLFYINKRVKQVKFVDRTFNADYKRAIELWDFIAKNNISTNFHFEISAHLINDETLKFLGTVPKDLFQFEVGVQTTNFKTIEAIDRKTDFEKLSDVVKKLKALENIHLHLDLIAGLPYEGYESFKNSFNNVYALNPDVLQLGFLKLLKGSKIRNETALHDYKFIDFPPYEVLENKYISYDEINKLKRIEEVLELYKNSEKFDRTIEYVLKFFDSAFDFYSNLANFWLVNGCYDRKISVEEAFDIFIDFCEAKGIKELNLVKNLLKFEYDMFYQSARKWHDEVKIDNFKEFINNTFNTDFIEKFLPEFKHLSRVEVMKQVKVVAYNFDVLGDFKQKISFVCFVKNINKVVRWFRL